MTIFLKEGVTIRDILLSAGKEAEKPFRFTPLDFLATEEDPYELLSPVLHGMDLLFGIGDDPKHGPITTFRDSSTNFTPRHARPVNLIFTTIVVYSYLGIHFIAWNFTFPTPVERTLWRAAVCLLVTAPITYMLFFLMGNLKPRWFGAIVGVKEGKSTFEVWKQARPLTQYVLCTLFIGCYGVARLFVLVEAMVGLRAMERDMFRTVEWSDFFPHV